MLLLLLACAHTPAPTDAPPTVHPDPSTVKTHGNLPVVSASELAAEDAARTACVDACTDDPCRTTCLDRWPIRQVEVVPDAPVAPTP